MIAESKKIFKDIPFFIVNESSPEKNLLKEHGGKREFYVVPLAKYVISDTVDFPDYSHAIEIKLPIVTSNWVHMCLKCETLLPHEPFSPVKNRLFSNLIICPSQIPPQERDALLSMILFYGGKYKTTLDESCTHLVIGKASGLDSTIRKHCLQHQYRRKKKLDMALQHRPKIKIVTLEWISDCIKNTILLPESEYEPIQIAQRSPVKPFNNTQSALSTPKIVNSTASTFMTPVTPSQVPTIPVTTLTPTTNQQTPAQNTENKESVTSVLGMNAQTSPSELLKGFVILFIDYKERLPPETFIVWRDVITKASGKIADTYSPEVTHVLCLHQQSSVFKKALEDRKKISTAYWLNDMLVAKKVFPPETPLHLPVPFTDTITEMKTALISVTGYESHERNLVKHMINFLGAQYTGYLSRNHTFLICKTPSGEKYNKAKEWSIPIVNAKWLGDMIQTGQSFPCKSKTKYAKLNQAGDLSINPTFSTQITEIWDEFKKNESGIGKKRKAESETDEEKPIDGQPQEKQPKKNQKVKRVLFTGLTGTTVHRLRQNVVKLKGELARGVNDCTHLVAPKIGSVPKSGSFLPSGSFFNARLSKATGVIF